jgi:hypothetical protein
MCVTPKNIRNLIQHSPFKPFRLHLADGKSLRVPCPDFILITAELAVVASEQGSGMPGEINLVPYEHIVRIEMLPRRTRAAA